MKKIIIGITILIVILGTIWTAIDNKKIANPTESMMQSTARGDPVGTFQYEIKNHEINTIVEDYEVLIQTGETNPEKWLCCTNK